MVSKFETHLTTVIPTPSTLRNLFFVSRQKVPKSRGFNYFHKRANVTTVPGTYVGYVKSGKVIIEWLDSLLSSEEVRRCGTEFKVHLYFVRLAILEKTLKLHLVGSFCR